MEGHCSESKARLEGRGSRLGEWVALREGEAGVHVGNPQELGVVRGRTGTNCHGEELKLGSDSAEVTQLGVMQKSGPSFVPAWVGPGAAAA